MQSVVKLCSAYVHHMGPYDTVYACEHDTTWMKLCFNEMKRKEMKMARMALCCGGKNLGFFSFLSSH